MRRLIAVGPLRIRPPRVAPVIAGSALAGPWSVVGFTRTNLRSAPRDQGPYGSCFSSRTSSGKLSATKRMIAVTTPATRPSGQ